MKHQPTIIDILKKGNLELFHSSMIAWLLDPNSEHSLGNKVLFKILDRLNIDKQDFSNIKVETESRDRNSRHDIVIKKGNQKLLVFENKCKSIGNEAQLKKYQDQNNCHLVLLGPSELSFSNEAKKNYDFITYAEISNFLADLKIPNNGPFNQLILEYQRYLNRESELLAALVNFGKTGIRDYKSQIDDLSQFFENDNDKRFLNLVYLEKFMRDYNYIGWHTDKNMISGVWMASPNSNNEDFNLSIDVKELNNKLNAWVWYHVELKDGVLSKTGNTAGEIQIRGACENKSNNHSFFNEFTKIAEQQDASELKRNKRPARNYNTFCIYKQDLKHEDILFDKLNAQVQEFRKRFEN